MKRLTATLVTLVVLGALAIPAHGYNVVSGHPRMFVTSADVSALRARCNGSMSDDYQVVKNWADDHINDSFPFSSVDAYKHNMCTYAFMYLVDGGTQYAGRAKAIAENAMTRGLRGQGGYNSGLALVFDWCYDYLTPAERQNIGYELGVSGLDFMNSVNWYATNNYHSKVSRLKGLATAGLPIYGEGIHDSAATTLCDLYREHTYGPNYVLACLDEIAGDGAYYEGDYNLDVVGESFVEGALLWRSATDEDPLAVSGCIQNMAEYCLYEVFAKNGPGSGSSMSGSKQGDSKKHTTGAASLRKVVHSLANVYRDPMAEWLGMEVDRQGLGWINRNMRWKLLILRDPTVGETPPTSLPDARWFQDMGIVYMRSGWDYSENSDDVYGVFRCEAIGGGHTNSHQNHLFIARGNDLLAIDSGVYDGGVSSHHNNYFCRTIAHNTITVYDPSEDTFGSYANDGGQRMPLGVPNSYGDATSGDFVRGKVEAFKNTDTFTYMKGDATAAYASYKLDLFTREVVYLKPNVFVVLDRVEATSPNYTKKWLLHSIEQPAISGKTATITRGDSKLVVTSVLPANAGMSRVGGSGHQFDVNGTNYMPSQGWDEDMGAWRIEITPGTNAADHVFLTVLSVGGTSEPTPDVSLVEGDEVIGVQVDGQVVLFSATGAQVETATYQYDG